MIQLCSSLPFHYIPHLVAIYQRAEAIIIICLHFIQRQPSWTSNGHKTEVKASGSYMQDMKTCFEELQRQIKVALEGIDTLRAMSMPGKAKGAEVGCLLVLGRF